MSHQTPSLAGAPQPGLTFLCCVARRRSGMFGVT
jgi:hypothetical protein